MRNISLCTIDSPLKTSLRLELISANQMVFHEQAIGRYNLGLYEITHVVLKHVYILFSVIKFVCLKLYCSTVLIGSCCYK